MLRSLAEIFLQCHSGVLQINSFPSCRYTLCLPICFLIVLLHLGSENTARCHLLPAYESTASRDHIFTVTHTRAVDTTIGLHMELDSIAFPESERRKCKSNKSCTDLYNCINVPVHRDCLHYSLNCF